MVEASSVSKTHETTELSASSLGAAEVSTTGLITAEENTIAHKYVELSHGFDLKGLVALFDKNAQIEHSAGDFRGIQEITRFYSEIIFPSEPTIALKSVISNQQICAADLRAFTKSTGDKELAVADFFTMNELGQIVSLSIYMR